MRYYVKVAIALLNVLAKIAKLRKIITMMAGNAYFTSPNPSMTVCATGANQLEAAYLKAQEGTKADKAALRQKEVEVDILFKELAAYVEGVANANPTNGEQIILSSGFELKNPRKQDTVELTAEPTGLPGELKIQRKAVRGAAYEYQLSLDMITWTTLLLTTLARFTTHDVPRGALLHIRSRVITAEGPGPWSEVVSVYVM
ncbi:MAG: hypothetical protein JSS79_16770 [Bacteroidetes bacterium]|nr:hypothetical protein [Bacteroidota bacterium]